MQALTLATAMHPMLMQGSGPAGEHFSVEDVDAEFPHKDEDDVCWQPVGYDSADEPGDKWVDYEDSTSEIMRAECDTQDWLEVCDIPLDWEEVPCDGKTTQLNAEGGEDGEVAQEESRPLPDWLVFTVQFASWLWEMHIVSIVTLPWWFMIFSFAMFDYALDLVFFLLFGWYCSFCAGLFIWTINLIHLPFTIWGWLQRAFLEVFGGMIDGWLLLFDFSGCFIFIGHNCYLQGWSMYRALDIPFFTKDVDGAQSLRAKIDEKLTVPKIEKPMDFWKVREQHRREFMVAIPVVGEVYTAVEYLAQQIAL